MNSLSLDLCDHKTLVFIGHLEGQWGSVTVSPWIIIQSPSQGPHLPLRGENHRAKIKYSQEGIFLSFWGRYTGWHLRTCQDISDLWPPYTPAELWRDEGLWQKRLGHHPWDRKQPATLTNETSVTRGSQEPSPLLPLGTMIQHVLMQGLCWLDRTYCLKWWESIHCSPKTITILFANRLYPNTK